MYLYVQIYEGDIYMYTCMWKTEVRDGKVI